MDQTKLTPDQLGIYQQIVKLQSIAGNALRDMDKLVKEAGLSDFVTVFSNTTVRVFSDTGEEIDTVLEDTVISGEVINIEEALSNLADGQNSAWLCSVFRNAAATVIDNKVFHISRLFTELFPTM